MMYVLTKLEKRAETTDTIIYFVSDSHEILEEVLLSLYDEIIEDRKNYPNIPDKVLTQRIHEYMSRFNIVKVPYLKN